MSQAGQEVPERMQQRVQVDAFDAHVTHQNLTVNPSRHCLTTANVGSFTFEAVRWLPGGQG